MNSAPRRQVLRRGAATWAVAVTLLGGAACSSTSRARPAAARPSPQGSSAASPSAADPSGPLVGIGGSVGAFDAAHPSGAGGYGPPLSIDGAVVLAFTRSLTPPVTAAAARTVLLSDLPADAQVVADISQATCEQIWLASSTVRSALRTPDGLVVVTLTTPGHGPYDPSRVDQLTFDSDLVDKPGHRSC